MDNFLNVYTVRLRPTESFSLSMCFHLVQVTRLVETEQATKQLMFFHFLFITRDALISTLSIPIGPKGGISWYIPRVGFGTPAKKSYGIIWEFFPT